MSNQFKEKDEKAYTCTINLVFKISKYARFALILGKMDYILHDYVVKIQKK